MTDKKTRLVKKLLTEIYNYNPLGNLQNLRYALNCLPLREEERLLAKNFVAQAHIATFNLKPWEILSAIDLFAELGHTQWLKEILQLTKAYGFSQAVWRLYNIGQTLPQSFLKDFDSWFLNFGIKWLSIYRDPKANTLFLDPIDVKFAKERAKASGNTSAFWLKAASAIISDKNLPKERINLLKLLIQGREPSIHYVSLEQRIRIDKDFRNYCIKHKKIILRTLQEGINTARQISWIYLIWDSDNIIKVYKEIINYNKGPLGKIFGPEDKLYKYLGQNTNFPRFYGTVEVNSGIRFMRQSVHYGQKLSDYTMKGNLLSSGKICYVITKIAEAIEKLHHQLIYYDIRPDNILLHNEGVKLLDLGASCKVSGQEEIDVYLADPQFAAPEVSSRLKASKATDVFGLGVLFHLLLTGKHPFELVPLQANDYDHDRESALLRYTWPMMVLPYQYNLAKVFNDKRLEIINFMLEKDPKKRPTLKEVINKLKSKKVFNIPILYCRKQTREQKGNIVLFPARMGIPHRGHIEYIARLIELGFHVLISLQRSYTITDRDPIQKFFVMKMVARSLIAQGFSHSRDFSFIFTPLPRTREELRKYFDIMPAIKDVVAIASGNPGAHTLFPDKTIFDQKTIFGIQGKCWKNRSWGEKLRRAIRQNDHKKFRNYTASGVEEILTFNKLQKMIFNEPQIEFAEKVEIVLTDGKKELVRGLVLRYISPEEQLISYIRSKLGWSAEIVNLFTKDSLIKLNGKNKRLIYQKTEFHHTTLEETIFFKFD